LAVLSYIAGMCGRATYKLTWEEIVALYRLTLGQMAVNTRARYNVCPTTTIDTILDQDGKRRLERLSECAGALSRRGGRSRSRK
jgi:putative SOS response-associated peptidase YedK